MSDSDKIRLDPATLRFIAYRMRTGLESVKPMLPPCPDTDAFVECITSMADESDELATQEEARPPRLSDWVRACEASKLGVPKVNAFIVDILAEVHYEHESDGAPHFIRWTVLSWQDSDAHVALSPDHYIMSHDGESWTECGTPAELTAALNALAEEVKP